MKGPVSAAVLLAGIVALAGCKRTEPAGVYGSGTLEATEITVSGLAGGRLMELRADEGDAIRRGAVVAVVDTAKLATGRDQARAALAEIGFTQDAAARSEAQAAARLANVEQRLARAESLVARSAATRQSVDDITTERSVTRDALAAARASRQALAMKERQIRAQIRLLDQQIADGTVLAPADGVILTRYVEPGEAVRPTQPLFTLADLARLWVRVYVPEADLGRAALGAEAKVAVDAFPGRSFVGRVTWISPRAEFTPKNVQTREARADLVYAVKVSLANPRGDLKIGMPADVWIEAGGAPAGASVPATTPRARRAAR